MSNSILVTGAPGNVGSDLVRLLLEAKAPVRVGARRPERVRQELPGAEPVLFDFEQPSSWDAALEGVARIFLVRPPPISDVKRVINPFLDRAQARGVRHVVFLSLLGAEKNPVVPHAKIEKHLKQIGMPSTLLRPTYFMQNFSTTYRAMIARGEIGIPAGGGKMSLIDARDISAVAAKTLLEDRWIGQAPTLTGSEAYDFGEMAEILSRVLGRPVKYTRPSVFAYRRAMKAEGMPGAMINVTTAMYLLAWAGLSAGLTGETEAILGRPPLRLEQFVADHAAVWR